MALRSWTKTTVGVLLSVVSSSAAPQVVERIVRPQSAPWRCRYAEILPSDAIVRGPKYFVSHGCVVQAPPECHLCPQCKLAL